MTHEASGVWYCALVDQEQSDGEAEEVGEYDDHYREPQKAAKTEYAGTTLELHDDGRYELKTPHDHQRSFGSWSADGGRVALTESEECTNGYEGLAYARHGGARFVVAFELLPDAHDGRDVLVLTFGREAPAEKGANPTGFVDRILGAADEDEVDEAVRAALASDDPAERARELWDAWVEGRIASDPATETHYLERLPFTDERLMGAGGFSHAHAAHALEALDPDREHQLATAVRGCLPLLPVDDVADAALAPLIRGTWLRQLVASRLRGGGAPAALFQRKLMPQPDADDATRALLAEPFGQTTRFEEIPALYPEGHAELPSVIFRYRGRGQLTTPLPLVRERGIEEAVRNAAIAWLEEPARDTANSIGKGAVMWAVLLSVQAGEPLPASVVEALEAGFRHVMGSLSEEDADLMREAVHELPSDQAELVRERFGL